MTGDALSEFGTEFGARLREEQVIWITTVGRDGTPQPNPVSFLLQDDDSILTYNMINANRLTHVVDRPRVALHFDGDGAGRRHFGLHRQRRPSRRHPTATREPRLPRQHHRCKRNAARGGYADDRYDKGA